MFDKSCSNAPKNIITIRSVSYNGDQTQLAKCDLTYDGDEESGFEFSSWRFELSCRFSNVSQFLGQILKEHIELSYSLDSELISHSYAIIEFELEFALSSKNRCLIQP